MKEFTSISIILSFLLFFSCNSNSKPTLDYSTLNYDSSRITILKWDASNPRFPNNSEPLPLTQTDVQLVDSLLKQAVDSFNKQQKAQMNKLITTYNNAVRDPTLFLLDLSHFKIEYVPYNDVNGHDIVEINCLCNGSDQSRKYEEVWGRHRNFCHFQLSVDLKQGKSSAISIDYNFG